MLTEYRKLEELAKMCLRVYLSSREIMPSLSKRQSVTGEYQANFCFIPKAIRIHNWWNWTGPRSSSFAGSIPKWDLQRWAGSTGLAAWTHPVAVPKMCQEGIIPGASSHCRQSYESLSPWLINLNLKYPVPPGSDWATQHTAFQPGLNPQAFQHHRSFFPLMALVHLKGLMFRPSYFDPDWHSEAISSHFASGCPGYIPFPILFGHWL